MNTATTLPNELADLVREGWELLVNHLGLPKAIQFVVLLERGKGDSVAEIKEYWDDASIDDIHARIMQWKAERA
ncbi:MAG: hypothetical protein JMDDDDMK_03986 [Acidobacteria bacterium]|nr:hypothetical protein [Acidobacteriota bacterium]